VQVSVAAPEFGIVGDVVSFLMADYSRFCLATDGTGERFPHVARWSKSKSCAVSPVDLMQRKMKNNATRFKAEDNTHGNE
jgi:hypothetical protein